MNPKSIARDSNVNATVLAEVFGEFLRTNDYGWRTLKDIVTASEKFRYYNEHPRYNYFSNDYRAKVFNRGYADGRWLTIKLTTDGSEFNNDLRRFGLSRTQKERFNDLFEIVRKDYAENYLCKIFCNDFAGNVGIKLFSKNSEIPHILIEFAYHEPLMDDTAESAYNL